MTLAAKIAEVIDLVQESQGVQQNHEIEAIVIEILKDAGVENKEVEAI
jgi:hypothetical protein